MGGLAKGNKLATPAPAVIGWIGVRPEDEELIGEEITRMLTEWRSGDDFQAAWFHDCQAPSGDFEGSFAEIGRPVSDGDGGGIGVEGDGEFFANRPRLDGDGDAIGKELRGDGEIIGEIGELVFWSDPEAVTAPGDKVIFAGDAEFVGVGFEEIGTTGEMEVGDDSWADIEGDDEFGELVGDA